MERVKNEMAGASYHFRGVQTGPGMRESGLMESGSVLNGGVDLIIMEEAHARVQKKISKGQPPIFAISLHLAPPILIFESLPNSPFLVVVGQAMPIPNPQSPIPL